MIRSLLLALTCAAPAAADITVITDIAPIHSLTAGVMEGTGVPRLLIPGESSPHDFNLRPSDAAAIGSADLVIWTGPQLTPWLDDPLDTLAGQTPRLTLLETPDWAAIEIHADDESPDDDEEEHDADDHDDDDEHDDHDGDPIDPHVWLDPDIASVWVTHIAAALSKADPDNAPTYDANARQLQQRLSDLAATTQDAMTPLSGGRYITPHDGLAYFEVRFDLPAAAHITNSHDHSPGPAHLATLRDSILEQDIACVLLPVGPDPGWASILTEGHDVKAAPIDLVGATLDPGPALYFDLIKALSGSFTACLS